MIPKFRAYHKELKVMYEVLAIDFFNKAVTVKFDKEHYRIYSFDDIILMQFTGLFDKNGVEIFEGDVVQSTWVDLQGKLYSKIGVVTYRDGYYSIKYPDDVEKYWWQALGAAIDPLILGNIYENPDLLESVEE